MAKDIKYAAAPTAKNTDTNSLFEPKTDENPVPGHEIFSLWDLSGEVREKLFALKNKGLDINAILLELLEKREREIEEEKERIISEQTERTAQTRQKTQTTQADENVNAPQKPSRYIPAHIRKIIAQEHGTKCSIEQCNKPSQHIHHTQRFALVAANAYAYATRATHTLHNPRSTSPRFAANITPLRTV